MEKLDINKKINFLETHIQILKEMYELLNVTKKTE